MEGGWRRVQQLSPSERLGVLDLLNRVESDLSREALDENRRRAVVHDWPGGHWLAGHDAHVTGYAFSSGRDPVAVELAGGGFDESLLTQLRASTHAPIEWWLRDRDQPPSGAHLLRTLLLMEVALPVDVAPIPAGVLMRTFEPGIDDEAWLVQNNLAFAHHPEQGAWSANDLKMRIAEPWFDPSGFLLFVMDDVIVASCWTKVHELYPKRFGEIYVISVHPDYQGHHLGRVAVTQGLDVLRRKGATRAALFVDNSNDDALRLYDRLGFVNVRRDCLVRFED